MRYKCKACGRPIGVPRSCCDDRACLRARALASLARRTELIDGHLLWKGNLAHGVPASLPIRHTAGTTTYFNPRALVAGTPPKAQTWTSACGNPLCLSHLELRDRAGIAREARQRNLDAVPMLPLAPLLDCAERVGVAERDLNIPDIKDSGLISVYRADRICIELLGVHPFFVYGDLFFTIGIDADSENNFAQNFDLEVA